ncbi:MAG: hypothetical protein ABI462_05035 [Ignavibacteria bacterium]
MQKTLRQLFFILAVMLFISAKLFSRDIFDDFTREDKLRIREAYNVFKEFGNQVWKNWDSAPFAILLVTDENEYLIYHPNPSNDFTLIGSDSITGSNVYTRPRQFSSSFLATFPAANGVSTIVVGNPANTGLSSMSWVNTILHEHFHQLQSSRDDYYAAIGSLGLAGDDSTGMWMLNYKFPYDDPSVGKKYSELVQSAKKTYLSINTPEFDNNVKEFLTARKDFKLLLNENDYKYFSFQVWQEGIARYTELKIADLMRNEYSPAKEFAELEDYIPADSFYTFVNDKILKRADSQSLAIDQRTCFYTLGALEGFILDKVNPDWKDLYFDKKFFVEEYY